MVKILFALFGVAFASIELPDNDVEPSLPTLLTGEQAQADGGVEAPPSAGALLETHASVQSNQNLRAKILAQMSALRNKDKAKVMQAVTMEASENLLGADKAKSMVSSLMQSDMDSDMNKAVKEAVGQKDGKRVTLEELLVVEDKAKDAMESVAGSLTDHYNDMMAKNTACNTCKSDCQALRWKKYKVHTMNECQLHCKIFACVDSQFSHEEYEKMINPEAPKYATSKFSSYLEDYSKAHGQQDLVVDDEGKFDVVWEVPSKDVKVKDEVTSDPMEQLRADKTEVRKSTEDVLKSLHMDVEAALNQDHLVKAIQMKPSYVF